MRRLLPLLACLPLISCAHGYTRGVMSRSDVRYRLAAPPEAQWRVVDFAGADLAWASMDSGHMMTAQATCGVPEDLHLDIFSTQALGAFTDPQRTSFQPATLDGVDALRTVFRARYEGVRVDLEVVALKKKGCAHALVLVSPPNAREAKREAFEALVSSFAQESAG